MVKMHCPACGLAVPVESREQGSNESCPRCLARSRGALTVELTTEASPGRFSREPRIVARLRRRAGRALGV